ncbi:MAG: DsrE family protein [Planctomycetota bacterium]
MLSFFMLFVGGCSEPGSNAASSSADPAANDSTHTVFLSVVSDVNQDPQSVDMALKFAGFSLEENRNVILFFNVKGVHIPTQTMSDDTAFKDNEPIKKQLASLISKGAKVHVCPICMKALGVDASDLIEGAEVTTRPGLFSYIGSDTTVFTY